MENELYENMEKPNDVFDKWLAEQLKENMVEPPANFTSKILDGVEGKRINGNGETLWIIILLAVSLFMALAIIFVYLLPPDFFRTISSHSFGSHTESIKNLVLYGTLVLFGVSFFYWIDNFFEHRYRNNKIATF